LGARSDTGRTEAINTIHDRLQSSLGRPDSANTLTGRMNAVFAALGDLAQAPADTVVRQQFLSELQGYSGEISRIADTIQSLREDASIEIESRMGAINDAIRQVHELNQQIAQQKTFGGQTGGLENVRQSALDVIAENIDIRTIENSDGSVDVSTTTGAQLVNRASFFQLDYTNPGGVSAASTFPPITLQFYDQRLGELSGPTRPINGDIRSGALRGLMDMRDGQLVDLSVSLGELGARVADEMNAIHNQNSTIPAPNSLTGKTTPFSGTDPHNFTGETTFAIVDAQNRVVATTTYDFSANPAATIGDVAAAVNDPITGLGTAGTLSFTNGVMSLEATAPGNGVVIAEDPTTPNSDRGGRSFSHFFGMNDLIEARSPGLFETGVDALDAHPFTPLPTGETAEFVITDRFGKEIRSFELDTTGTTSYGDLVNELNTGLSGVMSFSLDGNGRLVTQPAPGQSGLVLSVRNDGTDASGNGISIAEMFGIGSRFRAEAATDMQLVGGLDGNAGNLATARLDLSAAVGQVALAVGDQSGVLDFQKLETSIISTDKAGEISAQKRTLTSFNGAVLGTFGLMADRAATAAEDTANLETELNQRRQSVSGVNIDEELSNLIIYQNSYNAAARILSSVQELYDALLNAV
jgi:flagellar hook-associated protein 1 FlgK